MTTRTKLLGSLAIVAILAGAALGAAFARSPEAPAQPATDQIASSERASSTPSPTESASAIPPSGKSFPPYQIPVDQLPGWLSAAGDAERSMIEDGVLTFEEYEASVMRTLVCIEAAGVEVVHSPVYGRSDDIQPGPRLSRRGVYSYFGRVATYSPTPPAREISRYEACKSLRGTVQQMWAYHMAPTEQDLADMREHMAQCLRDAGATVPGHPSEQDLRQVSAGGAIAGEVYRTCQFEAADAFEIESPPGYSIPQP